MLVNYMAEAGENRGKEQFSSRVNGLSRDLLHKFVKGNSFTREFFDGNDSEQEEAEELELNLGLSLNGKFGVDPERANKKKLMRSSSVSHFILRGEEKPTLAVPIAASFAPLMRTCSLPTETEEEWRKRKESQSLRRMEAKRRRLDKLKFLKAGRDKGDLDDNSCEENGSNIDSNGQSSVSDCANGNPKANGKPLSQRSIGSLGSGSSGLSEFESQPIQVNKSSEVRSPSSIQSKMQHHEGYPAVTPGTANEKSDMCIGADRGPKESKMVKNVMPCVATIGDGPNGKRIEGFLYGYRKGEEVKIVCVCHGSFLSPAEFVKHAGGGDVEHPLKHIVVNPSPLL